MLTPSKKRRPKERRQTEQRNPGTRNLDRMTALQIVRLMNREDRKVPTAVARELPVIARSAEAIVHRMENGGRLIYVGAGSSGRIAVLDASECPPTFGTPPELVQALIAGGKKAMTQAVEGAEDRRGDVVRDLKRIRLTDADAVVGIAASGTTPYVLAALALANKRKALTIAITSNRRSPLARAARMAIALEVGPEVIAGSTRLKAGTAQKLVLNMLSTATMVRLGHLYDNLMIDVARTNEKLQDREKRILMEASGRDVSAVEHALRQSKHNLRLALIMLKRNVSVQQAKKRLAAARGRLRRALGE
ncbi:MAG TPA: N-acetylmuramic acid 6-phosphate etherase [Candidatus Acidoferrum sp.]|nr:N-acetylmuramic acid 6-phosphate etherase [Candidatus Acidoferrum sp.]